MGVLAVEQTLRVLVITEVEVGSGQYGLQPSPHGLEIKFKMIHRNL